MNCANPRSAVAIIVLIVGVACNSAPGRPATDSAVVPPDQIVTFSVLYRQNCAGCHGLDGKGEQPSRWPIPFFSQLQTTPPFAAPPYVEYPALRCPPLRRLQWHAHRQTDRCPGARNPNLAKPDTLRDTTPPPYTAEGPGDPQRGGDVYQTYCSSCHGAGGREGGRPARL